MPGEWPPAATLQASGSACGAIWRALTSIATHAGPKSAIDGCTQRQPYSLKAQSGSWTRLPAPSPLRTVHASFEAHGSSLYKGIFRHPVIQLRFRRKTDFYGNWNGASEDCLLHPIRRPFFSQYGEQPKGCSL